MIDVKLKDGSSLQVEQGSTVAEVAKQISMGLYRNAVGGLVDGEVADLRQPLEKDCSLEILTFEDAAGKRVSGTPPPTSWPRRCSTSSPG